MKRLLILLLVNVLFSAAFAAPVQRVRKTIQLANGQNVVVTICGDEDYTYMITDDGYVVDQEEAGYVLRSKEESTTMRKCAAAKRVAPHRSCARQSDAALRSIGSPEIAVILAEFTDTLFHPELTTDDPMAHIQLFFQGNGYDDNQLTSVAYCRGAVREYFRDQSEGKFMPNFTVVKKVKVANRHNYYKNNSSGFRNEVLNLATEDKSIDWTKFDSNGDGKVDGVIIVFAGAGNNTESGKSHLHPCTWSNTVTVNGVSFATQIIDSELRSNGYKYSANSIGVICHEMGHMLGLPDMYQTGVSSYEAPGMDVWDIMDYGEYVSGGTYPTGYSAYEKEYMGWITIPEITTGDYALTSVQEGGSAYRITNPGNSNEYYLLEVRNSKTKENGYLNWDYLIFKQSNGYFVSGCPGLLVTHYDIDFNAWTFNNVNTDTEHPRITIIPANGHFELLDDLNYQDPTGQKWFNELKGHTYPCKNATNWGVLGNNELTDTSAPAATLFNENTDGTYLMHKSITNITQDADEHISLHFADSGESTGISAQKVDNENLGVASTAYYSLDGMRQTEASKGVVILRKQMSDGSIKIQKMLR